MKSSIKKGPDLINDLYVGKKVFWYAYVVSVMTVIIPWIAFFEARIIVAIILYAALLFLTYITYWKGLLAIGSLFKAPDIALASRANVFGGFIITFLLLLQISLFWGDKSFFELIEPIPELILFDNINSLIIAVMAFYAGKGIGSLPASAFGNLPRLVKKNYYIVAVGATISGLGAFFGGIISGVSAIFGILMFFVIPAIIYTYKIFKVAVEKTENDPVTQTVRGMLCTNCGEEIVEGAARCGACSQPISPPVPPSPSGGAERKSAPPFAGSWARILAFAIDIALLGIVGLVLGFFFSEQFLQMGPWGRLVGFAIALPYFGILDSSIGQGQTVGKRILRIRVVTLDDKNLSFRKSLFRSSIFLVPSFMNGLAVPLSLMVVAVLAVVAGIGGSLLYLFLFNRRTRQSLHDLFVGAYVVRKDATLGDAAELSVARAHFIVLGVFLIILTAASIFFGFRIQRDPLFKEVIALQERLDEIEGARATSFSVGSSFGPADQVQFIGTTLILEKDRPLAEVIDEAAEIILDTYPHVTEIDLIAITATRGWDIGIASWGTSFSISLPPAEWLKRLAPQRQGQGLQNVTVEVGALLSEARDVWRAGNYERSLELANQALAGATSDDEKAGAHYWRAVSYFRLLRIDEAEEEALLAIELSPGFGASYVTLAAVSLNREDCDKGLAYAEKAIAWDPNYAWSRNVLGYAYLCLGDRERGIAELRTAVELDPENQTIRENLDAALEGKFRADPQVSTQSQQKTGDHEG